MGVLNVTPGLVLRRRPLRRSSTRPSRTASRCAARARDLVDIGGESTRPGADRVDAATETAPGAAGDPGAGRRRRADEHRHHPGRASPRPRWRPGATVVNDVSGGLADPAMAAVVADAGCPWVLMHWRGHSRRMQELAVYADVVTEVRAELRAAGRRGGRRRRVAPERIILDPGLGFAKTRRAQLGAHARASTSWSRSATRCCSGRAASRTSAACSPAPDGAPRPADEPGGRHDRHQRAGGRRRRLGGPGARRARAPSTRSPCGGPPAAPRLAAGRCRGR